MTGDTDRLKELALIMRTRIQASTPTLQARRPENTCSSTCERANSFFWLPLVGMRLHTYMNK